MTVGYCYRNPVRAADEAALDKEDIRLALAGDAAKHPTYAEARAQAVWDWVAAFDAAFAEVGGGANEVGAARLLEGLHIYEQHRGMATARGTIDGATNDHWAGVNRRYLEVYERYVAQTTAG